MGPETKSSLWDISHAGDAIRNGGVKIICRQVIKNRVMTDGIFSEMFIIMTAGGGRQGSPERL